MENNPGRILAVDPGDRRLGIAISDPDQIIASPLCVIEHENRKEDARKILSLAEENKAVLILVGQPLNWDGTSNQGSDQSSRLAELIRSLGVLPVKLWDEYGSTQQAQESRRQLNVTRKKRAGHLDQVAAAIILQNYLDEQLGPEAG